LILCLRFAEPAKELPSCWQGSCRHGELEKIAYNEGIKPQRESPFRADKLGEPGKTNGVDEDVSYEHRQRGAPYPAVPSALGKEPHHEGRGDEANEISTGWASKACQASASAGEDRKAYGPLHEVERDGEASPHSSKERTNKQDGEGLAGDGDRTERQGNRYLGK